MGAAQMSFRVTWDEAALAQLDEIWKASSDKEGVQNTATRMDTERTFNPLEAGESRSRDYRVLFKYPLVVWFRVIERLREVQVLHIRTIERQHLIATTEGLPAAHEPQGAAHSAGRIDQCAAASGVGSTICLSWR
jgi:plasmid stabilization system protein ParE